MPMGIGPGLSVTRFESGIPGWMTGQTPMAEFDIENSVYTYRGQTYASFDAWWTAVGGSYTRSGTKRYVDNTKTLVSASANVWPTEYDIRTGAVVGKSIWPAVTARGVNRRDLSNASWTKTSGTAAKDQTGIDGVANAASSFLATGANATCIQSVTDATSRSRCVAVFLKRLVGTGAIAITLDNGTTWQTITTQVVTTDWTEVIVSQAAVTSPQFGIRLATSGDKIAWDFGRVVDGYKPGPPLDDADTNSADSAIITLTSLPDFNFTEGTVAVRGRSHSPAALSGSSGDYISIDAASNTIILVYMQRQDNGGKIAQLVNAGSFDGSASPGSGYPDPNSEYRDRYSAWAAARYKVNDFKLSVDGFVGPQDTTVPTLPTPTRIVFGSGRDGQLGGWLSGFRLYRAALADAALCRASSTPKPIAVRGDSIAGGSAVTQRRLEWGYLLCDALTPKRTYGDLGVGGSTSADCLAAITADTNRRGQTHIVLTGRNDGGTAAYTVANLQAIDALLGGNVLFGTIPVGPSATGGTITRLNDTNTLIKSTWPTRSIDFNQAIIDGGGSSLFDGDGTHPNDAGAAAMYAAALAKVQALGL